MEIKIQIFGNVYSISIGKNTKWYSQCSFITIIREDWDQMSVWGAKVIFSTPYRLNGKWTWL